MNILTTILSNLPLTNFAADCSARPTFFGLKPWYYYLDVKSNTVTGRCELNIQWNQIFGADSPFLLIALVIIDDLLRIAALVAVGFIIWGGVTYVLSQGQPDQTGKAQNTIINALIGLVVALIAAGLVSFLGSRLA